MKNQLTQMAETRSGRYVWMPDIDLEADMGHPKTYRAEYAVSSAGGRTGRYCRVKVDHEATGTDTPGTGDTVVKVI